MGLPDVNTTAQNALNSLIWLTRSGDMVKDGEIVQSPAMQEHTRTLADYLNSKESVRASQAKSHKEYDATVLRVVDGDTFVADVSLGFGLTINVKCRMAHVDAPETFGPRKSRAGEITKEWLKQTIEGKCVLLTHRGPDKYGRALAEILLPGQTRTVNEDMLVEGLAVKMELAAQQAPESGLSPA